MCKTFWWKIREYPEISRNPKTAIQQPKPPINKEDAAISASSSSNLSDSGGVEDGEGIFLCLWWFGAFDAKVL